MAYTACQTAEATTMLLYLKAKFPWLRTKRERAAYEKGQGVFDDPF